MYMLTVLISVQCVDCKCYGTFCADTETECKVKARVDGWCVEGRFIRCRSCGAQPIPPAPAQEIQATDDAR